MKTKNKLTNYFRKCTGTINSLLAKPSHIFTADDLHKLRVEIKKLNALFKLVRFCTTDFKKQKAFKLFKDVFVQAGKIRELQLEKAELKKHNIHRPMNDYKGQLKMGFLHEQKKFSSFRDKTYLSKLKKEEEKVISYLKKPDKKCVHSYLDKKRKKLGSFFKKKDLTTGDLHKLRKHLKEFQYIRKNLNLQRHKSIIRKCDALQELLGLWHDSVVMTAHLKKVIERNDIRASEIKALRKIKSKFISDSGILLTVINAGLKKFDQQKI